MSINMMSTNKNWSKYWYKYQTFIINKLNIKYTIFNIPFSDFILCLIKSTYTVIPPSSSNLEAKSVEGQYIYTIDSIIHVSMTCLYNE